MSRHPISTARAALGTVLGRALADVDVLDWYSESFSKGAYVRMGETRANVAQETFSTQARLQFEEHWDLALTIGAGEAASKHEAFDTIMDIADTIMTTLANNTRLGGSDSLVWCKPESFEAAEQDNRILGTLNLNLRFRVNRRT